MNQEFDRRRFIELSLATLFGAAALDACASDTQTVPPYDTPQPQTPTQPPIETTPTPAETSGLIGRKLFIDPNSSSANAVRDLQNTDSADAQLLEKIARESQADWFGGWNSDIRSAVDNRVTEIQAAQATPVMVMYNILKRDNNGQSAGGAPTEAAYLEWVDGFAQGLKGREAVVIYEPDALGLLDNYGSSDEQQKRLALMANAIDRLIKAGASVYIEAAQWVDPAIMSQRLKAVGVERAAGVSVNTSGHDILERNKVYIDSLRAHLPNMHAVVDTSRNGRDVTSGGFCNPPGAGLGHPPTTETDVPFIDAYLWIKRPGESDGACNGGPTAGQWWQAGAIELAKNAL
jgi:endoglucanase